MLGLARGEDKAIVIDTGTALITERRAVTGGAKQTREWLWSKLVTLTHDNDAPWTEIAVENRQKVYLIVGALLIVTGIDVVMCSQFFR
jgi:hypothetical protein